MKDGNKKLCSAKCLDQFKQVGAVYSVMEFKMLHKVFITQNKNVLYAL